jgi:hypothetical protein
MAIPGPIHFTAQVLQTVFLVGAVGCSISIPIIAVKFASVLFEKDGDEGEETSENKDDESR